MVLSLNLVANLPLLIPTALLGQNENTAFHGVSFNQLYGGECQVKILIKNLFNFLIRNISNDIDSAIQSGWTISYIFSVCRKYVQFYNTFVSW